MHKSKGCRLRRRPLSVGVCLLRSCKSIIWVVREQTLGRESVLESMFYEAWCGIFSNLPVRSSDTEEVEVSVLWMLCQSRDDKGYKKLIEEPYKAL